MTAYHACLVATCIDISSHYFLSVYRCGTVATTVVPITGTSSTAPAKRSLYSYSYRPQWGTSGEPGGDKDEMRYSAV